MVNSFEFLVKVIFSKSFKPICIHYPVIMTENLGINAKTILIIISLAIVQDNSVMRLFYVHESLCYKGC